MNAQPLRACVVTMFAVALSSTLACNRGATTSQQQQNTAGAQQQSGKTEHTFRGKVEQVDANAKSLMVNGEAVPGWMGAMTMAYKPDNPDVLSKVKPGDQITAKVYDGDFQTLHDVRIVQGSDDSSKAPK